MIDVRVTRRVAVLLRSGPQNLASGDPLDVVVPRLIEAALGRGGRDNLTAVLIQYDGKK